jgi:hypothetical protein
MIDLAKPVARCNHQADARIAWVSAVQYGTHTAIYQPPMHLRGGNVRRQMQRLDRK